MALRPCESLDRWLAPIAACIVYSLPAEAQELSQATTEGFWAGNGDKVLVAVVTAVLVLLVQVPVKAMLTKLGRRLEYRLEGLGFRFTKRYLEALADQHRWLRLIGIYSRADLHPPRLQEVYISLRLAIPGTLDGDRVSWSEALASENRRVVILGGPGAGKSTLLDYLVLVLTGRVDHRLRARLGRPFPLFARLRELDADAERATLSGLLKAAAPLHRLPGDFPEGWLRRGGCVVLLDGLDEVLDEARHQRTINEIERLVADYPDNHFLVTCRVAGWRNQLPDFRTYEIQELQDKDIHRFAGAWYREVLRTQRVNLLGAQLDPLQLRDLEVEAYEAARGQAANLWGQLSSNTSLVLLARTPLMLSLMLLLHHLRVAELPQGRAALYERCLEVLLEIWDAKEKQLALPGSLKLAEKLMILRKIAHHFLEGELLVANVAELEEVVTSLLPLLSNKDLTAREILRNINERSGLLVQQALDQYGFAHRALADSLAARYIVDHELDERLLDRIGDERWREVTLISVGLAPPSRGERLVGAFLDHGAESLEALEMAGLSLGEDVQVGTDLKARILAQLRDRIERLPATESASFGRLAGALMRADLVAAERWMGEVLRGQSPRLRRRVLGMIPELGREHGRPLVSLLGALISEDEESIDLRSLAVQALADLGVEPDTEVWRTLEIGRASENLVLRAAATWAWCRLGRNEELGFVEVPAGEFLMGRPEGEGGKRDRLQHSVFLPTYFIGRFPVTVAEFRAYEQSTRPTPGHADTVDSPDNHPVTWVSWHEALGCARWYGGTLPSEAEWEKAARGVDGRRYPWGDEWREGLANIGKRWGRPRRPLLSYLSRYVMTGRHEWIRGRDTTPVGTFSPAGDSAYGCADMAGNVWEWTRSLWGEYPYPEVSSERAIRERLDSDTTRVIRGGGALGGSSAARCFAADAVKPSERHWDVGFRLLLSPFSSEV